VEPNPDITRLRAYLREQMDALGRAQQMAAQEGNLELFRRIGLQILEIEHRARMLGRVEFAQASAGLAARLAPIEAGKADLEKAIARIEQFNAALKAIARFLGLVDKVVAFLA
jgi:replicative DNA helicase